MILPSRAACSLHLAATLLLFPGCRKADPDFSRNRDLIAILDAHDKLETSREPKPDLKSGAPEMQSNAEKYVIHGEGGQLFYLEDLRAAVARWEHLDANLTIIARVSQALKAQGIRLLVVPAPTKVETRPELLGGRDVPDLSPSKNRFLHGLDSLNVDFLDLRNDFFAAKRAVRLFPRTDTHWDQSAIRLAAAKIAARIRPDWKPVGDSGLSDTTVIGFQGDLAEKFQLTESDTVHLQRVGDGRGGFFVEPNLAEVILYGDSFLRQYSRYSASLGAHLSRELGYPVKTVYSLRGFIEGPERIREIPASFPRAKVLVWVFTSRSLMEVTF
ncbi:MAG: hypothetical protein ABIW76_02125 [Fibrobacteria bacterium]